MGLIGSPRQNRGSVYPAAMPTLLLIAGFAALGAGASVSITLRGDVQAEMAATCFIGAVVLFGLSAVLSGQRKILDLLRARDESGR